MAKVLYAKGTKEKYLSLSQYNSDVLYWCADTRELFNGADLYSDGVRFADSFEALPEFQEAADGILYICNDSGNGYVLSENRDSWVIVIHGVDNETIEFNENGLMAVKAVPVSAVSGLETRLQSIEQSVVACAPIATADVAGIVKPNAEEFTVSEDGLMSVVAVPVAKVTGLEVRLQNIEAAQVGGVRYMGSVPTVDDLPADAEQGHLYEVEGGSEWCFNGEKWFEYGHTSGLKPIARVDINEAQFQIDEANKLNLIAVEAAVVNVGDRKLNDVIDALEKTVAGFEQSITWMEM